MKYVTILLAVIVLFCGCTTTYMKKEVEDSKSKIKTKYVFYHKNRFTEKSFDDLKVYSGDQKPLIEADKYSSIIDEKAIKEVGVLIDELAKKIVEGLAKGTVEGIKGGV